MLGLVGCGSGGGRGGPVPDGLSAPVPPASPAGLFAVPAPGTVLAGPAQKDSSALVLERGGSEFEPDFAQRVAAENSSARYSPAWTSDAAGFGKLAYAIYSFNLQDYSGMQTLQLTWGEAPLDHANLWIGLSRWERDCWRWRRGPSSGLLDLGAAGYEQYIKPGTGELLIAVVMTGTAQALLDRLQVGGATRSDWWMFGHDTLHNRRSQAVGHGSSNLRWRFRTGAAVVSSPAFGADGAIYFGSDDGCVYALNPDCSVRWTFTAGGPVRSSPAVSLAGTVYVGCDNGIL